PIEDAVMSIQGIKSVSSSSKTGSANITVEFELGKDIDLAVQEIQNAVARVQRRLPREMDPVVIQKTNPEDNPILFIAVTTDKWSAPELMTFVRDRLKDRFSTVPGVAEVFLGGYIDPNLRVWVSSQKLSEYSLTVGDVLSTISSEHSERPSGRLETGDRELNVRTLGEAPSVEDFSKLMINRRGGSPNYRPIPLGSVARVEDGLADVRRRARSDGKTAVGLGIRKQRGSNAVEVAAGVKKRLEEVRKSLPPGVYAGIRNDSTRFIEESAHEMVFTLVLAAILTAAVMWLFLGSFSATTNVVLAIPTSVIGAFMILNALGFTVNTFTILGLSLAIGIVVDDAIMVLENIVRHKEMGKSRLQAALEGTAEISFAAIAATVAIMAIFLPVAFMKGIIGRFLFQFGITLTVAVALSLLEALTLTPMRSSRFLEVGERRTRVGRSVENAFSASARWYRSALEYVLDRPWTVVLTSVGVFIASLGINSLLKKEFVPPQDQGSFMIRAQAPVGSSIDYTDVRFALVEKVVMARPEVSQYFGAVGGFGGGDVDTAMMFVQLKNPSDRGKSVTKGRSLTQQEIMDELRGELKQKVGGLKVSMQDLSLSGFSAKRGFPIEFTVRGPVWDRVVDSSRKMISEMEKSGMMVDIDSDYRAGMPEVQINPDREKARIRGVSIADIDQTINALVGGQIAGKFTKNGRRFDIRVRLVPEERDRIE
ncbi:MAG: efflux RND transporter permease subunit, partial [Planctomycetes bacterium]|nr:efflux RND transporter permease subunit [Planctomycetota bacterium]